MKEKEWIGMNIELLGAPRVVMENPFGLHRYFAWPTVARLKNGRIALSASGYRLAHICPFGKAVLSFSDDEGKTYHPPFPVFDTPLDDRDAGLCPFGTAGLIVTSFNNTVEFQRKRGAGDAYRDAYLDRIDPQTEEEYLGSLYRVSFDNGVTFGPIRKSPVTSPHGPLETADGRILYVGRNYDSATCDCISVVRLDPESGAWEHLASIPTVSDAQGPLLSCEPHAVALPDGRIVCHIRVQRAHGGFRYAVFGIVQTVSEDGGYTWSEPEWIADTTVGAPAHLLLHSSGALISAVARRNEPFGIRALISRDGGRSWEGNFELYRDEVSADLGYPSTVELSDGTLQTVFYAHRKKGDPCVILAQDWRLEDAF